jgi:hypothetical protein
MHPRITDVKVRAHYILDLSFTDGSQGRVDLSTWFGGHGGLFTALQDPAFFAQVAVDREAGTIVWPNGVDLDPDMLFLAARGIQAPA